MSESLRLYRNITDFVFKSGTRIHDMRCYATFLWAIVGLVQSKTIHMSKWVVYRKSQVNAASKHGRCRVGWKTSGSNQRACMNRWFV